MLNVIRAAIALHFFTIASMAYALPLASGAPVASAVTIRASAASGLFDADRLPSIPAMQVASLARSAPVAPKGAERGVFASVAISAAKLPASAKYRQVTGGDFTALFGHRCASSGLEGCDTRFAKRLRSAADKARGLDPKAMLALVNREVNLAMAYRTDSHNWGRGDYWATPSEMAKKGAGDCEDFAIAKLWMLRALGVSEDRLQIVVLSDAKRHVFHAVLVAHLGGKAHVLDNLSETVRTDSAYPNYVPIMSFAGAKSYIHGFESRSQAVAYRGDLGRVRPGEGI